MLSVPFTQICFLKLQQQNNFMKLPIVSLLLSSSLLSAEELTHEQMMQTGKSIYELTCISCHGVNGDTDPEMKLVVRPRQLSKSILSEDQMFQIVKHGAHSFGANADIMPTFKYVYDDKQIRSVVHYVSHSFNKDRAAHIQKLLDESTKLSAEQKAKRLKSEKRSFTVNAACVMARQAMVRVNMLNSPKRMRTLSIPTTYRKFFLMKSKSSYMQNLADTSGEQLKMTCLHGKKDITM